MSQVLPYGRVFQLRRAKANAGVGGGQARAGLATVPLTPPCLLYMFCTENVMPQLNIHLTPEFQRCLSEYMRLRQLKTKSEAVRQAVREALEEARCDRPTADFKSWLGIGNRSPQNPQPQFHSDDDLWD